MFRATVAIFLKSRFSRFLVFAALAFALGTHSSTRQIFAAGLSLESASSAGWGKSTAPPPPPAGVKKPSGNSGATSSSSGTSSGGQKAPATKHGPNRLFGTVEFRSKIKNMPKWERVLGATKGKNGLIDAGLKASGRSKQAATWGRIKASASSLPPLELVKQVNAFFNQWSYRYDMDNYGVPDYWATPHEFLVRAGDCEDYAITKMFALKELGFATDHMRLVVLKDKIRNIDHAVLAIYIGDDVYIMDNMTNQVYNHERFSHYQPQLSVNGVYRWAHMPAKK